MNIERFFFLRKFPKNFVNLIHKRLYGYLIKKANLEIPDPESLKGPQKGLVTIYLSGRKSRIEQFLLGGLLIENGYELPTHSFGSKAVFFRAFKDLFKASKELFHINSILKDPVRSIYIPVDSPEELMDNPYFSHIHEKLTGREIRIIPVITLWNKELSDKSRWKWMQQFVGKYNLWSTFWEVLMLILKRRKLTLRIGFPVKSSVFKAKKRFVRKLYKTMKDSRKNVVGASLKSWLELQNDSLLQLSLRTFKERRNALKIIRKMSTKYSAAKAEIYTNLTGKLLKSLFTQFHFSDTEIGYLRKLCATPDTNILLVPTHRSYFDYLILNYLLYSQKVTVPLVAAGDNLNFFPLGMILRKMGAFFIRRKIRDDRFYVKVLRSYLKNVVSAGYNIEFFIEGGRSRSGTVRSPRTGMLKMLSEIGKETGRKLYVVPVSITYEKLKEIEDYQLEKDGVKVPEKKNFYRRLKKILHVNYGPAYVRFARPIYLSSKYTPETALRIAEAQEKSTVISFSALFSTMFLCFKELEEKQLVERMEYCCAQLNRFKYIQTARSLESTEKNAKKLLKKLLKKGDVVETLKKSGRYKVSSRAAQEFSYYKNSIAFAFAPFFCEMMGQSQDRTFVLEYLEAVIMGFNEASPKPELLIEEKTPAWFKELLEKFFMTRFEILGRVSSLISEYDLNGQEHTFSTLVDKIFPVIGKEFKTVTADEIYEILFFLEKKSVLLDNLSAFNKKENTELTRQVSSVISLLRGA